MGVTSMSDDQNIQEIESRISELTQELQDKLSELDPNLIAEIKIGRGVDMEKGHWSDWHDNWKDGPRWSKTWGKAGGKSTFDFNDFENNYKK
jgi:hypothetical protein